MPKRRRSPFSDSSTPCSSEHANTASSRLNSLFDLDELFLRVLSFLGPVDLARVQGVSRRWCRMAGDLQLWKALYLERYPHPHRPNVEYTSSGTSTPLRPIARLPSRAFPPPSLSSSVHPSSPLPVRHDGGGIILEDRVPGDDDAGAPSKTMRVYHDGVDWKRMMRLRTNWSNGNALSESSISLPPSPRPNASQRAATTSDSEPTDTLPAPANPHAQHHIALFPSFICTSSPHSPLVHVYSTSLGSSPEAIGVIPPPPGWSSPSRPDNITAVTADQEVVLPEKGSGHGDRTFQRSLPARLGIFYSSGGFAIVCLRMSGSLKWERESVCAVRTRPRRRNGQLVTEQDPVVDAALSYPVLVTCTLGFQLSVYVLGEPTPRLLRTLHSDIACHPAALSLFPSSQLHQQSQPTDRQHYRAALTYCSPIYPSSWTVSVQEVSIELDQSRKGSWNIVSQGQSYSPGGSANDADWPRRVTPVVGVCGRAVGVGSDGRWCVLAGDGNVVHVYALPTSATVDFERGPHPVSRPHQSLRSVLHAHTLLAPRGGVSAVALAAGRCVSGGLDGRVLVWDLDDPIEEDGNLTEARVGHAPSYVEVRPGGRRPKPPPPFSPLTSQSNDPVEGGSGPLENNTGQRSPHITGITSAARTLFLATPPAVMRPAAEQPEGTNVIQRDSQAAIRQLAFDEERIVGLVGHGGVEVMRIWSFNQD